MGNSGKYGGIRDAVKDVQSNPDYTGPDGILAEVPSRDEVIVWTEALTGFEANSTVSKNSHAHLKQINSLYERSKSNLADYARDLSVSGLNEFPPEAVLFLVCIRDLQNQSVGKENLNTHKFSVLRGGRYSVK